MKHSPTISVDQLCPPERHTNIEIVDVRTALEFREVHAAAARNIPLDALDPVAVMQARHGTADAPLYVICKGGARGAKACQKFRDAGFPNVINVEGGTEAWEQAGLPVVRGKPGMSLERQVRIAAGSIVLIGASLAIATDNLSWVGIPAFIGAGLMFAGITDTCGMGMLIAKMPWNRTGDSNRSCSV